MQTEEIQKIIQQQLNPTYIRVMSEDGRHFQAIIVSEHFVGKTRVQNQQMVYACIQTHLQSGELHAISLKTYTPSEWQQLQMQQHNQ
jgi:acid stress-induced BolA-like protein IbaG/YrbA